MEQTNKRFKPYARPAARRQSLQPTAQQEETFNNIPQVIVGLVKKSLSWLGITKKVDPALEEELNTTKGDFEILPAAHKDSEASGSGPGKLYPDLTDYTKEVAGAGTMDFQGFIRPAKRHDEEDNDMSDAMRPERIAHRRKLRRELMESVGQHSGTQDNISTHSLSPVVPIRNPFLDPSKAFGSSFGSHTKTTSAHQQRQQDLFSVNGREKMDKDNEDNDGLLSQTELKLLERMRKLTETPLEKARRSSVQSTDYRVLEENLPRVYPSSYTVIRPARQESQPSAKQEQDPLSSIMPYNKDYRKNRQSQITRRETVDHAMESIHSGSDADESEHARNDRRDSVYRTKEAHSPRRYRQRDMSVEVQPSPERRRRTSRTDALEDQRTSRGGLQIRSQVTPKRHLRSIPGRFSALDSDEEEEALRQIDLENEIRVAQRASGSQRSTLDSQMANEDDVGFNHTNGYTHSKVPPQIYPSLNYGQRSKFYNPKLEQALRWTSSPDVKPFVMDTWRCPSCDSRTNVASSTCDSCSAARPAPLVLNTTPVSELLAAKRISEPKPTLVTALAPKAHEGLALTTPGFSAPATSLSLTATASATVAASAASATSSIAAPAVVSNWAASGFKAPDASNKWKCPTCDVMNEDKLTKCPCCETAKPGAAAEKKAAPAIPNMFSFQPPAPAAAAATPAEKEKPIVTSNWAASGFKAPDASNKWKCPTCDVMNEDKLDKCPCCETGKPGASAEKKAAPVIPNMFAPPPFGTPAADKAPAAPPLFSFGGASSTSASDKPATAEKAAAPPMFSFGSAPAAPAAPPTSAAVEKSAPVTTSNWAASGFKMPDAGDKWKCPTCDVMNEDKLDKCPCCETAKPGASAEKKAAAAVPNMFSFQPPAAAGTTASPFGSTGETKPMFGGSSTVTPAVETKAPAFSFGTPAAASTSATDSAKASEAPSNPFAAKLPAFTPPAAFGASSTSATSAEPKPAEAKAAPPMFSFGGSTTTSTASSPPFGTTTTSAPSAPLFGGSTAGTSVGSSLFSLPAPASSAASSAPMFGAATTAPASTPALSTAAVTPSPFAFGASTPSVSFGQSTPATSSPFSLSTSAATTTPAVSAPGFNFTGTQPPTPTMEKSGTFGGFGGFGASSTPASSATAPAPAASTGFTFGATTPSTSKPASAPSFTFGSSGGFGSAAGTTGATPSPFNFGASASTSTPAFGASASTTTPAFGASASSSTPAFGAAAGAANSTSGGFGGFGATSNSSMMSPTMSAATPSTATGGFGGFGASAPSSTPAFGASTPQTTGFGQSSGGFGSQTGGFGGSSMGATPSTGGFGGAGGFGSSGTGGFGSASASSGFGSAGSGGFGAGASGFGGASTPSAGAGGFGSSGGFSATPGFGSSTGSTGFGASTTPLATPSFGGFGASSGSVAPGGALDPTKSFGFMGNPASAPGGMQYAQQQQQQPSMAAGGFSFNMGAAPSGDDVPANRKFAKMRTKKRN